MVVNNLSQYLDQLMCGKPLFIVEALLSAPEIVLHPHANELVKLLMAAMREVVERYIYNSMGTCTVGVC